MTDNDLDRLGDAAVLVGCLIVLVLYLTGVIN